MTSATRGVGIVSLRGSVVVDMRFERISGGPVLRRKEAGGEMPPAPFAID